MVNEVIAEYKQNNAYEEVFTGIYELSPDFSDYFDTILIKTTHPQGGKILLLQAYPMHYDQEGMLVTEEEPVFEITYLHKEVEGWSGLDYLKDAYVW